MTRYTGPLAVVRRLVLNRDLWMCARCGSPRDLQQHHRRPRGMGGTKDPATNYPSNLITLCAGCHQWVEGNRRDAFALGFLVAQADDPAGIPLKTWRGLLVLAEDGTYTTLQERP